MAPAGTIVATRYHNVICALMLSKPTISIGYGEKNAVLMADTGLAEYCQAADSLDVGRLIEQFIDLESHAARLRHAIIECNAAAGGLSRASGRNYRRRSSVRRSRRTPDRAQRSRPTGPSFGRA